MATCFVIQPFDKSHFDDRYDSILSPAISKAGLKPYRVDRDHSVSIPIETIESEIRSSRICLADISLNNPNVWYEVGYAYAALKEVVMICDANRPDGKFPFDVQHRKIIEYKTGSPQAFGELEKNIIERIAAILKKESTLLSAQNPEILAKVSGLQSHEIMVMASICESIDSVEHGCSSYSLHRDMENHGFTKLATNIGVKALMNSGFVRSESASDEYGEQYAIYSLNDAGWEWIIKNSDKFNFQSRPKANQKTRQNPALEDDIPF
jgi:hypothetical protein